MEREKSWVTLKWSPTAGSKTAKSRGFQAMASNDQIRFPENIKDGQIILDQLIKFPTGKNDDGVDMCSEFAYGIDKVWNPTKPEDKKDRTKALNAMDNGIPIEAMFS